MAYPVGLVVDIGSECAIRDRDRVSIIQKKSSWRKNRLTLQTTSKWVKSLTSHNSRWCDVISARAVQFEGHIRDGNILAILDNKGICSNILANKTFVEGELRRFDQENTPIFHSKDTQASLVTSC